MNYAYESYVTMNYTFDYFDNESQRKNMKNKRVKARDDEQQIWTQNILDIKRPTYKKKNNDPDEFTDWAKKLMNTFNPKAKTGAYVNYEPLISMVNTQEKTKRECMRMKKQISSLGSTA